MVRPIVVNNNNMYELLKKVGAEDFIVQDAQDVEHIHSYCQIIGSDFNIEQINDFIKNVLLKSDAFSDLKLNDTDVGIHIRNTDYLNPEKCHYHDCFNRQRYLSNAIDWLCMNFRGIRGAIVFSDDIALCEQSYGGLLAERFDVVKYSRGGTCLNDFVKLSGIKHKILWNSTFSYWSAFISNVVFEDSERCICCPSKFSSVDSARTRCNSKWNFIQVD